MLSDLKELEKFLKICRKQGVLEISFAGTAVKLGDLPLKADREDDADVSIPTDELTPEQLMFYAINGGPAS